MVCTMRGVTRILVKVSCNEYPELLEKNASLTTELCLQVMAKLHELGGHFLEQLGKRQLFTQPVPCTERTFGNNLHLRTDFS